MRFFPSFLQYFRRDVTFDLGTLALLGFCWASFLFYLSFLTKPLMKWQNLMQPSISRKKFVCL